jgi:hypothetical protein
MLTLTAACIPSESPTVIAARNKEGIALTYAIEDSLKKAVARGEKIPQSTRKVLMYEVLKRKERITIGLRPETMDYFESLLASPDLFEK